MKSKLLKASLLMVVGTVACYGECNLDSKGGSGPTPIPSPPTYVVIVPTPTPSPSPMPNADDPCDPTSVKLDFHDGSARTIKTGERKQLDFTPMKGSVQIIDACNSARFPVWSVETVKVSAASTSVCSLAGTVNSYIPVLAASTRTGDRCVVRAYLDVSSGGRIVRHEAAFEAEVQ